MSGLNLPLNDQFSQLLPADSEQGNFPRQVNSAAFSWVMPKKTAAAKLIATSEVLATELGFTLAQMQSKGFAQLLSGNYISPSMKPYAMNYGGHQFGHWAGQLGDGRAINLGQINTLNKGLQTLQLKGAGPTPYSHTADGLAVLRSSIREFLCSEAMHYLGVPTTRALSLCLTGDSVIRDMFYDGNAKAEPGAVVCRVSSSFLRFGSFQLPTYRSDHQLLKQLVDYSISHDFDHLGQPCKASYLAWFSEITERTAQLIVHWMRVGFVHGVMNTDNMSIIGETIDYGPYGWIDNFDLTWTPNTTDAQGRRYCFGRQPEIAQWNLFQLANAIYPLINEAKPLEEIVNSFADIYQSAWRAMMANKLGLVSLTSQDDGFIYQLEQLMSDLSVDMTLFYRKLPYLTADVANSRVFFKDCFYHAEQLTVEQLTAFDNWLADYLSKVAQQGQNRELRIANMNQVNPKYVLRNFLAQQAIEQAEQGDYHLLAQLQQVLTQPYDEQPEFEHLAIKRPAWADNKAGCAMLSCSS